MSKLTTNLLCLTGIAFCLLSQLVLAKNSKPRPSATSDTQAAHPELHWYENKALGFRILVPEKSVISSTKTSCEQLTFRDGPNSLIIEISPNLSNGKDQGALNSDLNLACDKLGRMGKETSRFPLLFKGHEAREMTVKMPADNSLERIRILVYGPKIIRLFARGPSTWINSQITQTIFESYDAL